MKKINFFPFLREQNFTFKFLKILLFIFIILSSIFLKLKILYQLLIGVFGVLICIFFELLFYKLKRNENQLLLKINKGKITVRYTFFFFKKFSFKNLKKITLMEYFYFPYSPYVDGVKWYGLIGLKDINKAKYISVFIIYKEHLPNDCPWSEEIDHVSFSQKTYDAFSQKIFNKDMILLDATFKNYQFLRQFYEKESFADSRAGGKDMLTEFENRLIENKNKKALKTK